MLNSKIIKIQPEVLEVTAEYDGIRLDRFIKLSINGIQQSHLEKLIGSGGIRVDGKKSKPNYHLSPTQKVTIPPKLKDQKYDPKVKHIFTPSKADLDLMKSSVIIEENDFIALNKPSGIAVQGGSRIRRHIDGLIEHAFENIDKHYLVHRLDLETSGALLIAKTRNCAKELSELFKTNKIEKIYIAIVCGKVKNNSGIIDLPIIKGQFGKAEKVLVDQKYGLKSITEYKVFGYSSGYSLLLLFPKTGRTHQIRVHLSHLGNSILGDRKYGGVLKIDDNQDKNTSLKLHCFQMSFKYKNKMKNIIKAELNNDFNNTLKLLNLDQYLISINRFMQNEN